MSETKSVKKQWITTIVVLVLICGTAFASVTIIKKAKEKNAKLLTTEKDWVRLPKWAKKEIKFSALQTDIDSKFYAWLKGRINEISKQKN